MKKILIIENQPEAKEILINKYSEEYDQIDIAESGLEAFYYIHQYVYNTVIVSNELNDLNALWLIQYLKNNEIHEIILTSSYYYEYFEKKASKLNVKFLRKPL